MLPIVLNAIIAEMRAKNILYVPSTDPRRVWYDDRATPAEYLRETTAARKIMLAQYGPGILQAGEPIGALRDMRLWMTYPHHRCDRKWAGLRWRHVPQHRHQGRNVAADGDCACSHAARGARVADGGARTSQPRHPRDAARPAHTDAGCQPRGSR